MRPLRTYVPLNEDVTGASIGQSPYTQERSKVSIATVTEKEIKTDNIWKWAGNIVKIRTQQNYDRVLNKRKITKIEASRKKLKVGRESIEPSSTMACPVSSRAFETGTLKARHKTHLHVKKTASWQSL